MVNSCVVHKREFPYGRTLDSSMPLIRAISSSQIVGLTKFTCVILACISFSPAYAGAETKSITHKCLYISSYHRGYDWSDGVEEGLRSVLAGKCEYRQFDMNTKINKSKEDKIAAAKIAAEIIETWNPDVVITSDDNAVKYVVVPYYKDSKIPFVFSGVNWTVEEYGFPFDNVTGIVEVAPIEAMLQQAMKLTNGTQAVYLGADTLTEEKNYSRISSGAEKVGLSISKSLVSNFDQWLDELQEAQSADFIVMGSNSGINHWNEGVAVDHMNKHAKKLSVTNHAWMMGVTSLGFTKIPQEHGEWAGEAGLAILDGVAPIDIPIVKNHKWELWLNSSLIKNTGVKLPANFSRKAKRLASID